MGIPHDFDATILREYDIRGIVDKTLTEGDAGALGRAFGTLIGREGGGNEVIIGFDGRDSSPKLERALIDGLTSVGMTVKRIGLGPTPMLYYAVHELKADGGIMVTGSHNPPDYNGFKMMLGTKPVYGEMIQELGRMAAEGDFDMGEGAVRDEHVFDKYVERLARDYNAGDTLSVAWDPGNGAAGAAVEALTKTLPGKHVVINGEIDGSFPNHHPDPTVEKNLEQLKQVVKGQKLDLGLAFDGDGDRIGAVDAQGRVVWGDQILLIIARDVLKEVSGATVIADVKASQVLFDGIAEAGGKPVMWKTGHSLIKVKMSELSSPVAGEMSGHIFFRHKFYGHDDGVYAGVRLLNAIANQGGDLAKLRDAMPQLLNTPEIRFPCPEERKKPVMAEVKERVKDVDAQVIDVDGVRVVTEDGWWLLRASNTQDVLVARCEARDEAGLERLKALLREQIEKSGLEVPEEL